MKTVWTGCAFFCLLGLICSGGLFFNGHSILSSSRDSSTSAAAYGMATLRAVSKSWDRAELERRLDPSARASLVEAVVRAGEPLGGLKHAKPLAPSAINESRPNGTKRTTVTLIDEATFEHGVAQIRLVLVFADDQWHVRDFEILPTSAPPGTKS
ncbi:MAG TPA: hypothetical protein VKT78_15205 [Fimbriimonadaceae bacterium]|nr:hypothetical protein [Fimbriimonadaceae bacterium]